MKTLYVLAKIGLHKGSNVPNTLESWMWHLDEKQKEAEYLSLHKTKADTAWKGGRIIAIRKVTENEVAKHQEEMKKAGKEEMKTTFDRYIIEFEPDRSIVGRKVWPKEGRSNPMTYIYFDDDASV